MRKWIGLGAGALLAGGLLSGCASVGGASAPVAEGAPDGARAAATAETRYLNVKVVSSGSNEAGKVVAAQVERAVRGHLANNGVTVKSTSPDLLIAMDVEAEVLAEAGRYVVCKGRLRATAQTLTRPAKDLGLETFSLKSDRKLGKDEALLSVAEKLASDAADWSVEMVDPTRSELLANDVTVVAPWYKTRRGQADYAAAFVKEVSGMAGVVNCRVVSHDYANKTLVFRVVYLRDAYPEGLLNKLATKDSLNIKPKW